VKYISNKNREPIPASSQQLTKEGNAKTLFDIIAEKGSISRAQLAKITGLSPSTVSVLTEELIRQKMILEAKKGGSSPTGRKPIMLEVDPQGMQIPCFTFKATGLLYVLYDLKYQVIEQKFQPYGSNLNKSSASQEECVITPSDEEVFNLFDSLLSKRAEKLDWGRVRVMTIAFPGAFWWDANTYDSSFLGWRGSVGFVDMLQEKYGNVPLLVGNVSEFLSCAEKKVQNSGKKNLMYVYIGHGVGSGVILDNQPYSGEYGLTGEFGHVSIDYKGKKCRCGNCGCLEGYVTIPAIINSVRAAIFSGEDTLLMDLCGYEQTKINLTTIATALSNGDPLVTRVLQDIALKICVGLNSALCLFGAMDVYIGGGIEELGDTFLQMLRQTLKEVGVRQIVANTTLHYSALSNNAECLGAVNAYVDNYFDVI